MKVFIAILQAVWLVAFVSCYKQIGSSDWNNYKAQYGKSYRTSIEESQRMNIWMASKASVERHNKLYELGKVSYSQAVNQFSDMTAAEKKRYTGLEMEKPTGDYQEQITINVFGDVPKSVDWRKQGAVTPVKNQGQCGSCYAFSVIGALESQHFLKTKKLVTLSEQQLVDCSKQKGCNGGVRSKVFDYIVKTGGADSASSYPYSGKDSGKCRFNKKTVAATAKSYALLKGSEENLKNGVAKIGPISVGIAVTSSFHSFL
jgi:cathepsin L